MKWTLDEEHGGGFRIPDSTLNMFADEFALETKNENARKLRALLENALTSSQTNKEIYEFVVRNEFLPKHANEILKDIQKTNPKFSVLDYSTGKKARKSAFYLSYDYYKREPVIKMQFEK